MERELVITVRNGKAVFVYDDELVELLHEGTATVTRASHVEPAADLTWTADMRPSGGPMLTGFGTRSEALEAERQWLSANRGL